MTAYVIGAGVALRLAHDGPVDAEHAALTHLQADAFAPLDDEPARAASDLVPIAPIEALT